ncbi:uncharacterized protein K452DRAFT_137461 [Aplosporella prunicola CBS 121167]|uniref:R3H-associated N-terminal domain-containing protein n=1 Tax=Aplosporella prunicola CBS 121167 TaxID=1176127 RepID=A0A6A6BPR7_9PEZI|nr:uncharacterized protein K452DRAFT_137461 [Aplosporella prunicola CBS 121167]KAF2145285.1 hypothetical protein K452DRAFT_137461 [Aplosporella prunicola CBS 121167]
MAVHPEIVPDRAPQPAAQDAGIDIDAWHDEAVQAMTAVTISAPSPVRGTTVKLDIPLDDHVLPRGEEADRTAGQAVRSGYIKRKEPLRRDSLKRREALLKGKEGSRRRQRWENDRLLSNPYAQPPLPADWEIRPTYPVQAVPYYLATYWDAELAARAAKKADQKKATKPGVTKEETDAGKVPKELREKLKRARGAKGLLRDLEEEVRKFVESWEKRSKERELENLPDPDSEDEEIVFVGRNGQMNDIRAAEDQLKKDMLVFDSLETDGGAAFGRFLVHSIGAYYNLRTWSVTRGTPARREAYVGIREKALKTGHRVSAKSNSSLPQPLWSMV